MGGEWEGERMWVHLGHLSLAKLGPYSVPWPLVWEGCGGEKRVGDRLELLFLFVIGLHPALFSTDPWQAQGTIMWCLGIKPR